LTSLPSPSALPTPDTGSGMNLPTTGFDVPGTPPGAAVKRQPPDICQPGVMLRALAFVYLVLALGVGFVAADLTNAGALFLSSSAVALPALLLWLSTNCLAQGLVGSLTPFGQWLVATASGAVCAVIPWQMWTAALTAEPSLPRALAVAGLGAVLAWAISYWLQQRARLRSPTATTARLVELQARIRPHFLFNTLNTAIALVRVDPARAEAVLEDLSELFRAALVDGDTQATATLEQEVALARRYLAIEQLRFGDRLQIRWDLDPSGNHARVPPLLLQPLVENAVRHGVEPAAAGGTIRVRTRVRRGQVEIAVVNTVPTEASTPGHGIALMNVRERLRLMHDVTADFRAGRDGSLYRVRILVPL
jgi:two-component system, LytTR family, sensor histidine kinase AlgZ